MMLLLQLFAVAAIGHPVATAPIQGYFYYVCEGATAIFWDVTPGGTWSIDPATAANASVSATGVVTGVSAGTATLSYTAAGTTATTVITVYPTPAPIIGSGAVCSGSTTALTDVTEGGVWNSSIPSIATITANGVVSGTIPGVVPIYYTTPLANCRATLVMTVNQTPSGIGGPVSVCTGSSVTLSDFNIGGVWSASNSNVTVDPALGIVTGVTAGSTTISYQMPVTGCVRTFNMVVNSTPAPISGITRVCIGTNSFLSDATTPGISWTSSNPAVATIAFSGALHAQGLGSTTITYTISTGCIATTMVSVESTPLAITGNTPVCVGSNIILSNPILGGTWSSNNAGIASIDLNSGVLSGMGAGTTGITYILTNSCGTAHAAVVATVNPLPNAISGNLEVCEGLTTALNDLSPGGSWSTSNGNALVTSTGLVTGINGGTTSTVTYTLPTGCYMTAVVTINPLPSAIGGTLSVCAGSTTFLTDATFGGTWSTSPGSGVATIDMITGMVTGMATAGGTTTVTYTLPTGCITTAVITVNPLPAPITGNLAVCQGLTTQLSDASAGGTWSSSDGNATVDASGLVTGNIGNASSTITYTLPTTCIATATVIVNPLPLPINGVLSVCQGLTTTLTDATPLGVWSTGNNNASVGSATGTVTGLTGGTTSPVTYTLPTTCIATAIVTINPLPLAITGNMHVCFGATTTLTDATVGGTWSSSAAAIASISSTGVVSGLSSSGGTATITYAMPTTCMATTTVTVVPLPGTGTITGPSTVNIGTSIQLTDPIAGGVWSASNAHATISVTGRVTGVTSGPVTISYTVSNAYCSASATKLVTVSNITFVNPISGYFFYVCEGATAAFWNNTTGGTWSMDPASLGTATVSPVGVVYGVSAGVATLSYTAYGTTVTTLVTVYPTPAPITGTPTVCMGSTTTLFETTLGGAWTSAIPSVATVAATGEVSAVVSGTIAFTVPIYYTTPLANCRATMVVTVNPNPSGIGGATSVCVAASIPVSDFVAGGIWTSDANLSIAPTGSSTASVSGVTAGSGNITYTLSTGCYRTYPIRVNANPAPVTGTRSVCTGAKTFLRDATTPGVSWISSDPSKATISYSGAVTGIAVGTATMTYTIPTGCIATAVVTVNPTPGPVAPISGPSSVSRSGGAVLFTDATGGGLWTSSNPAVATVGAGTGLVTAIAGVGSTTINYIVTNAFGCSAFNSKVISVTPAPHGHGGTLTVPAGSSASIATEAFDGEWTSTDDGIATVDASGAVTGIAPGNVNVVHTVIAGDGQVSTTITEVQITAVPLQAGLSPNPNRGTFTIKGKVGTGKDAEVTYEITNMLGQLIYNNKTVANSGIINNEIHLTGLFANGMYILTLRSGNERKTFQFVIE